MKRVQGVAVARFLDDGFDAVTVEEIADAADVSPMSVYRWFGTKEGLVIWDEHDPPILAAIAERLSDRPPLDAVRDGLITLLDDVYDRERSLALDRTRLIVREPALRAASTANGRVLRAALNELFRERAGLDEIAAEALAATAVALLEVAVERWERDGGRRPLAEALSEAFAVVTDRAAVTDGADR